MFSKMSKSILLILGCAFLTGCAPKFEIESRQNEFRNTSVSIMKNNYVNEHDAGGSLIFNLQKDTEKECPYTLEIEIRQSIVKFKDDSHMHLHLTNACGIETLLLKGSYEDSIYNEELNFHPGSCINGVYRPGSFTKTIEYKAFVYFDLTSEELCKIFDATAISFELETTDRTIHATLSEDNIEHIQEFRGHCDGIPIK